MRSSGSRCGNSIQRRRPAPVAFVVAPVATDAGKAACRRRPGGVAWAARLLVLAFGLLAVGAPASGAAASRTLDGALRVHFVEQGETLLDIARANGLGALELMAANPGVDPWIPRPGSPLVLPVFRLLPDAPQRGIVLNLAELRLYYFGKDGKELQSFPIGIGRLAFTTPLGTSKVVRKQVDPTWYPNAATRAENPELPAVVPPGPDNPLGRYALYLGWPQYAIHGTNRPWGVGRRVSRGCIRLYPEDIAALYPQVAIGTPVTVVDQPAKIAWHQGRLYLEIHPSRAQLDALEESGAFPFEIVADLDERIRKVAGDEVARIDWRAVREAEAQRRGFPVPIIR
jgi:L,D-transpeptidase ErfK/SrfK